MSLKIVSRGKGKSAVAAASYRAGICITNEYDRSTHDYSHKRGIVHTEVMLPSHAPREYFDRSTLWNAVETVEKAKNSVLAREIEIALPVELSRGQNIELVCEYVRENFLDKGMCADVCIHDTGFGNPHAHVLCTVRPINENGTWGSKQRKEYIFDNNGNKIYDSKKKTYKCRSVESTDWNSRDNAEIWRKSWAKSVNKYLEENNLAERVDHRSYERQGKEQIPTIHLGQEVYRMEKRGIRTEFGDRNRKIHSLNS
jgi:ATP-dependent exoDNAse (exonuclease V) alpha subunit